MKYIDKLPEKWCIKSGKRAVVDYCNQNGISKGSYTDEECAECYCHFPSFDDCTTRIKIAKGYTEITFDEFSRFVLGERMYSLQEMEAAFEAGADLTSYQEGYPLSENQNTQEFKEWVKTLK